MASLNQNLQSENSLMFAIDSFDCLYCEELSLDGEESELGHRTKQETESLAIGVVVVDDDDDGEDEEELAALLSKEEAITQVSEGAHCSGGGMWWWIATARREAVEWMMRVNAHYGFSNTTLVLGVNNFDRFSFSIGFQRDRPWMIQLAAVSCLTLACKFEETHVPLLLDFQVDCKYVFEPKTIQRMELLVLSTLNWRMNPVTPFSYLGHLIRRLGLEAQLRHQVLSKCEELILSLIIEPRFLYYPPSVMAAATMVHIMNELEYCGSLEHHVCLMFAEKIRKDKVEDCCRFITEISNKSQEKKPRHDDTLFCSPIDLDENFGFEDNSKDLGLEGAMALQISDPAEPLMKKIKYSLESCEFNFAEQPSLIFP
ncbi:Belongs to the cyclin [Dionaea muscipula]